MRERFTLACRIIGLVIFCFGLLTILAALPMLFMRPDVSRVMVAPEWMAETGLWKQTVEAAEQSGKYWWAWALLAMGVSGVIPLCLGLYLMMSGRLIINLCYPEQRTVPEDRPLVEDPKPTSKSVAKEDDRRFMPPGTG